MLEGDTSFADADDDVPVPTIASLNEAALRSGMIRTVSGAQLVGGAAGGAGGRSAPQLELDNPTPQLVPPPTHAVTGTIGEKHVLVMARARHLPTRAASARA